MTFDLNGYNVIVDGISPEYLAEGEIYNFVVDGDDWSYVTGADGKSSRAKTNINTGVLSITTQRTSPTNTQFATLRKKDLTTPGGYYFKVLVKDTLGQTVIESAKASFVKSPDAPDSNTEVTSRTWDIKLLDADIFIGGND